MHISSAISPMAESSQFPNKDRPLTEMKKSAELLLHASYWNEKLEY